MKVSVLQEFGQCAFACSRRRNALRRVAEQFAEVFRFAPCVQHTELSEQFLLKGSGAGLSVLFQLMNLHLKRFRLAHLFCQFRFQQPFQPLVLCLLKLAFADKCGFFFLVYPFLSPFLTLLFGFFQSLTCGRQTFFHQAGGIGLLQPQQVITVAFFQFFNPVIEPRYDSFLLFEKAVGTEQIVHRRDKKSMVIAPSQIAGKSSQIADASLRSTDYQYPEHLSGVQFVRPIGTGTQVLLHFECRLFRQRMGRIVKRVSKQCGQGNTFYRRKIMNLFGFV